MSRLEPTKKPTSVKEVQEKHISGANIKKDEPSDANLRGGMIGEGELGRTGGMKDEAF